jgi:hypothetical protein
MAVTSFIPEIWAAGLLRDLEKTLVYGQPGVISRDYEGSITAAGDTVHIGTLGAVTIREFTRNTDIEPPETLTTADQSLLIDQEYYFNFQVDDVDAAQAAGALIGPAQAEAAYGLADTADQFIAALYAGISNEIGDDGSPVELADAEDAYDLLVDIGVNLSEANVPTGNRFVIIPPWVAGLLAKDERILLTTPGVVANGFVGTAAGLRVLQSNNVPSYEGDLYKIVAGYPGAWTFAQQILKVEAYRPEGRFADAIKGLHVYGGKVLRPTKLVVATASPGGGS